MTDAERILEVLANALNGASVGPYRELPPPDEYFALYARSVWSRIDRDALRAALLEDVRKEAAEPGGDMQAALLRHVNRTLTPEAAKDILAAVLRLLRQ